MINRELGGFDPHDFDPAFDWHPDLVNMELAQSSNNPHIAYAVDKERVANADVLVDFSAAEPGDVLRITTLNPQAAEDETGTVTYELTRSHVGVGEWYGVVGDDMLSVRMHGAAALDGSYWENGIVKQFEGVKLSVMRVTRQMQEEDTGFPPSEYSRKPETLDPVLQQYHRAKGQIIDGPGNLLYWRLPHENYVLPPVIAASLERPTADDAAEN
jgi:hypothetical protein